MCGFFNHPLFRATRYGLLALFFCGLLFTQSCRPEISATSNVQYMVDTLEVSKKLAGRWIVIPLLPLEGDSLNLPDYGDFLKVMKDSRKGHQAELWDRSAVMHPLREKAFLHYLEGVRKDRVQSDSLLAMIRGHANAKILFAPMLKSNMLTQTEDGLWKRKVTIGFKALDYKSGELLLQGSVASQHQAKEQSEVLSSELLIKSCFHTLLKDLKFNTVAGLSPQTRPDF